MDFPILNLPMVAVYALLLPAATSFAMAVRSAEGGAHTRPHHGFLTVRNRRGAVHPHGALRAGQLLKVLVGVWPAVREAGRGPGVEDRRGLEQRTSPLTIPILPFILPLLLFRHFLSTPCATTTKEEALCSAFAASVDAFSLLWD